MKEDRKESIEKLIKSVQDLRKKIAKKDPISDLLDGNNVAEMSPDNVKPGSSGALNKSKKKKSQKIEEITKTVVDNFQKLSKAYLEKKQLEKAKIDEGMPAGQKKQIRQERSPGFKPHKKEKFTVDNLRQMPKPSSQGDLKQKLKNKPKVPQKADLEYPMAASEKDKSCS